MFLLKLKRAGILLLASVLLSACNSSDINSDIGNTEEKVEPLLLAGVPKGLVIRGGECSAKAFRDGAGSVSGKGRNEVISNLSVNCTTNTNSKADFAAYTGGIPHATFCVSQWGSLARSNVTIVRDPLRTNRLHCLISGKTSEIVKSLTRFP